MQDKLKDFIANNKDSFDSIEPSAGLWHSIDNELQQKGSLQQTKIKKLHFWKWAAVASFLIIAASIFYYNYKPAKPHQPIAIIQNPSSEKIKGAPDSQLTKQNINDITDTPVKQLVIQPDERDRKLNAHTPAINSEIETASNLNNEELYHYTKLIEIRQKQIRNFRNEAPELYDQFSNDLKSLERSFFGLQAKLDSGFNNEQVLNAMIENLKMQSALLNKQLEITKHIKNKKQVHEATLNNL